MSVFTGRTRPTNGTRPHNDNQNNTGGGGGNFTFNLNDQDLPENLDQIGDTPFYNTPPQIEVNDCGQVHPSLAYLCDIDLQDPASFAEPSYEVSINGCGACVTMTLNYSATETSSTTYCYILPACRPEPEPEPEPLPSEGEYLIDWPAIPSLPALPPGDPNQRYRIVFEIRCRSTSHYVCGGRAFETYFDIPCQPSEYSNTSNSTITLNTQGIGRLKQRTIRSPRSEPVYDLGAYAVDGETITTQVFYEGLVYRNSTQASGEDYYLTNSYSWSNGAYVREYESQEDMYYGTFGGTVCTIAVREISPQPAEPEPTSPKLPSPQIPMNCCADVRRLMQMVARLEKRIGVREFPINVPQSLLADRGNNTVKLENIPEQISWLTKQLDALVGEFPGETEVEDIDPQTEGNQTKKFKFPNMAELLLEIVGLAINNKVNTETALTTVLNAMVEIGSVKTTAISNYHALQAILDCLGPDLKQSTIEVPLTFTPGETQIHKLLKPTNTKVKIVELGSTTDFQDDLVDLKKFAAEWRAQNFRKINLNGTEYQQISSLIKNAASFLSDENLQNNDDQAANNQNQVSDFSEFIEKTERGFTDVSGITDTLNPYGRPYNQRPRVREIGNTSDRGTEES